VRIVVAPSPIHGKGVFATEPIRKGRPIGRFEGNVLREDDENSRDPHVIWLTDRRRSAPYPLWVTNDMYFLNHSENPNAAWRGREVYALREIARGEEILINYWPHPPAPRLQRLRRVRHRVRRLGARLR
jgi:uncharacterized protein